MSSGSPPNDRDLFLRDCCTWLDLLYAFIIELSLERDPLTKIVDFDAFSRFTLQGIPNWAQEWATADADIQSIVQNLEAIQTNIQTFIERLRPAQGTLSNGDANDAFLETMRRCRRHHLQLYHSPTLSNRRLILSQQGI